MRLCQLSYTGIGSRRLLNGAFVLRAYTVVTGAAKVLETELFALLEHTSDAAFAVSEEGEILSWNKGAEKVFGYPASEVLHKTCHEVLEGIGPLGTRVCHQHCSVVECTGGNTDVPNFDMSVKSRSGKRLWINISTLVFDNPRTGRRLLLHLAHDITEQKKTEELVRAMLDLSKQLIRRRERGSGRTGISVIRTGKTDSPHVRRGQRL